MGPLKRKSSTVKLAKSKSMSGRKKNSKKRLSDVVDEATKSDREEDKDEDAKEQKKIEDEKKQEEEKKARFPIAPDGYLPNSVIRKIIKPPADTPVVPETTEEPWKLKPVPKMDSQNQPGTLSRLSDYDVTLYLSDTSMSNPNDDAEDRTQDYDEMTAVQAHHMSRESTSIPVPGREQSSTGQQNLLNSEATVLSKGRPLFSNMSRQATSAISEEADRGTDLIQRIAEEPWFPTDMEATMNGVVNAFTCIMDDVSADEHRQICDYIIQINQEVGYSDELLEKIADKLTEQLSSSVPDKRMQALRVISELGLNRSSIIKEILSLLAQPDISDELHQLAEDTLIKLTGATDKETLDKRLDELGLTDQKSNRNEQVEKENVDEELMETQNTNDNMSVLPEATQDQLVETWLEGTKGVEKDLTGLYREDSEVSRAKSADSKHSNNSRNSRESSKTKASKHTDPSGRSTPKDNLKNKLSVPKTEKDQVIKSHIGISNNKLTPDNPLMYKMYDSQRQALTTSAEKSAKVTRFAENIPSATERTVEDDSGFGQEIDSSSYSHEKSMRPGTRNLSPVQGSDDENNEHGMHHEVDTENWRVFFDEARKQKGQQRSPGHDVNKATRDPINLPPIRYLGDDVEMVTGDSGQRLLHSVSVKPKRQDSAVSTESGNSQKHKIQSLPARLGTNTSRDSPESYSRSASSNTKFLPALVSNPEPIYEWAQPVAPPSDVKPTLGCGTSNKEFKHYCDYSRLLKKRMHDHVSVTERSPLCLPNLVQKAVTN